jgi:hypothetical protein
MNRIEDRAREYASRGLSVIPLEPKGKKPLVEWKRYQSVKPTDEELQEWFGEHPERNIGIVTGAISGLVVVDLDSPEAIQFAEEQSFPVPPIVETPRGYHLYFAYPGDRSVRNFQKRDDLPGIDLRGDGGYVVAPPSIHPSGVQYKWVEGSTLDDLPLAPLPEIFLTKSGTDKTPLKDLYSGVSEGERNTTLTRLAGSWAHDGLTIDEMLEMAHTWNTRNNPPLPEKEVVQTVRSIYDLHQRNPQATYKPANTNPPVTEVTEDAEAGQIGLEDTHIIPATAFPIDVLPRGFRDALDNISESLHVEREIAASSMLTILSGAIGNTLRVSPKPGYKVPTFLWLINIAPTGYGKSPLISELMRPVEQLQGEEYRRYSTDLKDYESCVQKGKKDKNVVIPEKPRLKHFFVADITVESLGDVYEDNGRGVILHKDEISGLISGLNQYKAKGNDRQHYLQLFNAGSWKIDRKSGVKFLQNTGAAIIGGIQTLIMPSVFGEDSFRDGLVPRFLLVCAGNRPNKFSREGIGDATSSYWRALLGRAYAIPLIVDENGFVKPKIILLRGAALQVWENFYNEYNALIPFLTDHAAVFIPKLVAYYSLKLAGLLHCLKMLDTSEGGIPVLIDEETVQGAIELTRFHAGQAVKALRLYRPEGQRLTEYQKRVVETVYRLRDQVKNGKLAVSIITESFNQGLPEEVKHARRQIGGLLRGLALTVEKKTGNLTYLLWEEGRMNRLFSKIDSVTSVTTVTDETEDDDPSY